jgi:hypothetical protein
LPLGAVTPLFLYETPVMKLGYEKFMSEIEETGEESPGERN